MSDTKHTEPNRRRNVTLPLELYTQVRNNKKVGRKQKAARTSELNETFSPLLLLFLRFQCVSESVYSEGE